MSLGLYIMGWVLIIMIVLAVSLIVYYGKKIDECRTSKTLYCYAGENGWRCDINGDSTNVTTLKSVLDSHKEKCQPIDCPTSEDPTPRVAGETKYTIMPILPSLDCGTNPNDPCDKTEPAIKALLDLVDDPYTALDTDSTINKDNLMAWYCNPDKPLTDAKIKAYNNLLTYNKKIHDCNSVRFKNP